MDIILLGMFVWTHICHHQSQVEPLWRINTLRMTEEGERERVYLITGDGQVLRRHQGAQDGVAHRDAGAQPSQADDDDAHKVERNNHSQCGDVEMMR